MKAMNNFIRTSLIFVVAIFTLASNADQTKSQEFIMSATGVFEINLEPQKDDVAPVGRMLIDKNYTGGLVGKGLGQMISKRTESGAAVYSAIEEFEGSLDGKKGSFTLVHQGQMSAESQTLDVKILDGSGEGELKGISGTLEILQEKDAHKYVLNYKL